MWICICIMLCICICVYSVLRHCSSLHAILFPASLFVFSYYHYPFIFILYNIWYLLRSFCLILCMIPSTTSTTYRLFSSSVQANFVSLFWSHLLFVSLYQLFSTPVHSLFCPQLLFFPFFHTSTDFDFLSTSFLNVYVSALYRSSLSINNTSPVSTQSSVQAPTLKVWIKRKYIQQSYFLQNYSNNYIMSNTI